MGKFSAIVLAFIVLSGCSTLRPDPSVNEALLVEFSAAHVQLQDARRVYELKRPTLPPHERIALDSALTDATFLLTELDRIAAQDRPDLTSRQVGLLVERARALHQTVRAVVEAHTSELTEEQAAQLAQLRGTLSRLGYYFEVGAGQQKDRKEMIHDIASILVEVGKGIAGIVL